MKYVLTMTTRFTTYDYMLKYYRYNILDNSPLDELVNLMDLFMGAVAPFTNMV